LEAVINRHGLFCFLPDSLQEDVVTWCSLALWSRYGFVHLW